MTAMDSEPLIARIKSAYDGALPSGNSVALLNQLWLNRMTGNSEYADKAEDIVKAFSNVLEPYPTASTFLLSALSFMLYPTHEVVIVGNPENEGTVAMLDALRKTFLPSAVILFRSTTDDESGIVELTPFTKLMQPVDGRATAYVCQDFICQLPTTNVAEMMEMLRKDMKEKNITDKK